MAKRFVRFILVGIVNTLFSYSVYALLIFLRLHYSLAVLLAAVIGALFNFKTIGTIVFKNSDNGLVFRFFGVYAVTYLLNTAALGVCANYKANMYIAGFLLALPMAAVSFVLQSRFVFVKQERITLAN